MLSAALHNYINYNKNDKVRNYAAAIIWFIVIAVVVYAFYCTSKGYSFGVVANPFRVGCYS